ncbi:LysR family transcriptional regulator [Labrys sp. ZIDIC5]|uniref:LysR family transcriptional regulator n=1 Tax=Labrys sedimenti TaxID=3106036 RepID=UPI002ACA161E|nr:LysR family transcriptional regulator [Labrys sp. ZIDIC5]MDZ5450190.1 LysR family transcriptional regulator [Labrys sp. ZIDIC5]
MITVRQLSYFVAAAEHEGTAQAARALHVSQPAISVAIRQLEERIGQPLFVRRHAQGLVLTQAGRDKLAEARSILSQINAWSASPGVSSGRQTFLDVGCLATLGPLHLPPIIRAFRQSHPHVEVRMREGDIEELHRLVDNGLIEVALLYDLDLGRAGATETVAEFQPYVLVPAGHPLAGKRRARLRDVAAWPLILINLPHSRDYFLALFRQAGVVPTLGMEARTIDMVRGLVANGLGIALLTTRSRSGVSEDGLPLAIVELEDPLPPQKAAIITPRQFPITWMASAFIDHVRAHFGQRQEDSLAEGQQCA